MWYAATVTTAASTEPISPDIAKQHARVDHTDDDQVFSVLIPAVRAHVEKYTGLRFGAQTLTAKCDGFSDFARLPDAPAVSITSISYIDTDGATQTLSTDVYELRVDGYEAAIVLKYNQTWPSTRPGSQITVVMVVGVTTPADIKAAMLLLITHLYQNRQAVVTDENPIVLPMAVTDLLSNHRRHA